MIRARGFEGKNIALFGLGISGRAAVASLLAGGAQVSAWDDSEAARAQAQSEGIELTDLSSSDWSAFDALVLAPGVPLTHPEPHWTVKLAQAARVEIIGDTEIFMRALTQVGALENLIAITGTNGKSTTTALLGHMLNYAGLDVEIGGNIGRAVLELKEPVADQYYVIEFSSYQIDLTPSLKPYIGILLNISPDHLERHGDLENYARVKANLFARQDAQDVAIIGVDDALSAKIAIDPKLKAQVVEISSTNSFDTGIYVQDGLLFDAGHEVADLSHIGSLRGVHNWQNAAAAFAAARSLAIGAEIIFKAFESFPGLVHRMEDIGRFGSVLFINDSKATNAEAAARALACFKNIYWIAGGQAKEGGISSLKPYFPAIKKAYLIGEAADEFAGVLTPDVPVEINGTIDRAVEAAVLDAKADEADESVVLFSPACASFDQYRNFEIRGEAFKAAVKQAIGEEAIS